MHGLGNDFIIIDNFNGKIKLNKEVIFSLCNRHKGIGADGLILVEKSDVQADAFMNYYNSDGSQAENCGNGIRCVAAFLKNEYLKENKVFLIQTRAGVKEVIFQGDNNFLVNMGQPIMEHLDFPKNKIELEGLDLDFVSIGNPHAISFVDNLDNYDLNILGPKIENNSIFPNKINLEIVQKISEKEYKMKVWERGCGITLACGTGACAVYALAQKNKNNLTEEIKFNLPGGQLFISENEKKEILMTGEIQSVFSGLIQIV